MVAQQNATPLYTDAASTIWASRGGVQPLSTPRCGFDGKSCPVDFFAMYLGYFIAAIIIACGIVIGAIYGTYYIFRYVFYENIIFRRLNYLQDENEYLSSF